MRIQQPLKGLVRASSKNLGKTLESPDVRQRRRSPEDKENAIEVKRKKVFGVKNFQSPGSRKPFGEITSDRRSI